MKSLATYATLSLLALTATSCASSTAENDSGEAYPNNLNSITVEVPFDAGGTTDTIARLLAPPLEEELGIPVQVVNVSERDGQAGFEELANSDPNGAMIGFTNLPSSVATYLGNEAPFDRDSFRALGGLTSLSTVIAVHEDSDIDSLTDLVDAAKAAPGDVTLAAGALDDRIQVHQLETATGATFNKIPFEGGASGEVTALLGKKVDAIIGAPVAMIPNVESGDFNVIATFSAERVDALPDTPTSVEQGVDLEMLSRIGVSVTADTPDDIHEYLVETLEGIASSQEFQDQVSALGYGGGWIDTEQFDREWLDAEEVTRTVIEEEG